MMCTTVRFESPKEFWTQIVVPDFDNFTANIDSLRHAFHCAISMFHMTDWIYVSHNQNINKTFKFKDRKTSKLKDVSNEKEFANALSDNHPDFELIRQIANTAKHLSLRSLSPHPNAPSNVANTAVQSTGWGQGCWGQGPWGGTPRVMLATSLGNSDLEFSDIANSVFQMWQTLNTQHGWG